MITAVPDKDYLVGSVSVTDINGTEITVNDQGNGNYAFIMPGSDVNVIVTFKPIDKPSDPAEPENPAKPTDPSSTGKDNNSPKTGDIAADLAMWSALSLLAVGSAAIYLIVRRRKKI